ncbi:class I SAM-dependent methyltransferase [Streptomyces sp. HNM0575]|nr:class I SAM-dependent methyltransferase [Streptomyces sp. HNM0575]
MAESFGTDAERYDRARPRYPEALVERIAAAAPGPDLLDAGCGTGIAARQFQAAGCRVLGVEPDARMAAVARQFGIETDVAKFEEWDPEGRQFDAVVAGQAWHWIDPVAGAHKAREVLRPGGLLAAFWNVFQFPSGIAEPIVEACRRVMPDSPVDPRAMTNQGVEVYAPMLAKVADGLGETGGFGEPEQWRFEWEWSYTCDAWLDQMPTFGLFTRLPQERMGEILEAAGAAVDAMGGSFTMRYTTVAVAATRTGTVRDGDGD